MEKFDARNRTRRCHEEMVPHDPASLGIQAVCVQPLQSGHQRPRQEHAVSNVFPAPASPDEGAFFPLPGGGVHDVAMGDQRSVTIRAAQGILWLGRNALHVHRAVTDCALRDAGPSFDTVWAAPGHGHIITAVVAAESTQLSRGSAPQIVESRVGNDGMPLRRGMNSANNRCGIW